LGLEEGQVIEHPWVSKSIEIAQRRIEQHNFEIRKQLLEYDNVMNKQREVIYGQRRSVLDGVALKEDILAALEKIIGGALNSHLNENREIDLPSLINEMKLKFGLEMDISKLQEKNDSDVKTELYLRALAAYEEKEKSVGIDLMRHLERMVFLQIIDTKWKDHLYAMDNLREGIGLRAYGQRDPLIEYKREAFEMFGQMIYGIEEEAVETVFKIQAARPEKFKGVFSDLAQQFVHPEVERFEKSQEEPSVIRDPHFGAPSIATSPPGSINKPVQLSHPKVGRNDPCPCGSGKKYKKCCGK